jgi:3-methyladenine DNA glycosylase/8-oxoguanine DNA glycosylase
MNVRGNAMWTAKMYLIFSLDRQDILPYYDTVFYKHILDFTMQKIGSQNP